MEQTHSKNLYILQSRILAYVLAVILLLTTFTGYRNSCKKRTCFADSFHFRQCTEKSLLDFLFGH